MTRVEELRKELYPMFCGSKSPFGPSKLDELIKAVREETIQKEWTLVEKVLDNPTNNVHKGITMPIWWVNGHEHGYSLRDAVLAAAKELGLKVEE